METERINGEKWGREAIVSGFVLPSRKYARHGAGKLRNK